MKRFLNMMLVVVLAFCLISSAMAVDSAYFYNEDGSFDQVAYDTACAREKCDAVGIRMDLNQFLYFGPDGTIHFDNDKFGDAYDYELSIRPATDPNENVGDSNVDNVIDPAPVDTSSIVAPDVLSVPFLDANSGDKVSDAIDDTLVNDPLDPNADLPAGSAPVSTGHTYIVSDHRSGSDSSGITLTDGSVLTGDLKSLVISIFGEYSPVMTTATVTETVGDTTTTTLIDAVASGAAGVDYAWCAGVLLFAVLLYCLMKLLGGVLK